VARRRGLPLTPDEYRRAVAGAESEDDLLTDVLGLLRSLGWRAVHYRNSRAAVTQGDRGLPDVTAAGHGRVLYAELKREGEQPTRDQMAWLDALSQGGAECYVWRPSDWLDGSIERIVAAGPSSAEPSRWGEREER